MMEPSEFDQVWDEIVDIDFDVFEPGLGDPDLPLEPPEEPGPERGPRSYRPAEEPELGPAFTLVLCGAPIAFGAIYLGIFNAPAFWGPLGALALAGVFGGLYLGLFWWGSRWIESYRNA